MMFKSSTATMDTTIFVNAAKMSRVIPGHTTENLGNSIHSDYFTAGTREEDILGVRKWPPGISREPAPYLASYFVGKEKIESERKCQSYRSIALLPSKLEGGDDENQFRPSQRLHWLGGIISPLGITPKMGYCESETVIGSERQV
jgi:hypothetical protein